VGRWPIGFRHPVPRDRVAADETPATAPTPAAGLLAVQRSAGNRAVASLLARDATPTAPTQQRVKYVTMPGIGDIPIESVQSAVSQGGRGAGRPETDPGKGKSKPREVVLTSLVGDHSAELVRANLEGTEFDPAEIVLTKDGKPYLRIKLAKAMVSSYSVAGGHGDRPTESWTLTAEEITFENVGG